VRTLISIAGNKTRDVSNCSRTRPPTRATWRVKPLTAMEEARVIFDVVRF